MLIAGTLCVHQMALLPAHQTLPERIPTCEMCEVLTSVSCIGRQDILRTNGVVDKRLDVWQRAVDTQRFNPKCACAPSNGS
jgi:hypothetical protein